MLSKMLLLNFLTFIFIVTPSKVSCSREVTFSCGINNEIRVAGEKGESGVTLKGSKGEKGESYKWEEKLMRLEDKVSRLEQQLNESKHMDEQSTGRVAPLEQSEGRRQNLIRNRRDCDDVAKQGFTRSGVYNITVDRNVVPVYCDMETDGGRWLVFQKRRNGSEDFFRRWETYIRGFGNAHHEYWLGLENLHLITNSGSYQLRVDLEDWENNKAYALYSRFSIGDYRSLFQLDVCGYSGTAGNAISYNDNSRFTTYDRDSDNLSPGNCAYLHKGAWWHSWCTNVNLNGLYLSGGQVDRTGISWNTWKGNWYSMKRAEMKIRRNSPTLRNKPANRRQT